MEEQYQLLPYLVEKGWCFVVLAPEEAGRHGEGANLNPSDERVEPCLDESVGPDVPTECLLARDVAELLEGVIAGQSMLRTGAVVVCLASLPTRQVNCRTGPGSSQCACRRPEGWP